MNNSILVTGGAGFIGSNFVLDWIAKVGSSVLNVDKLTYAGNLENLASVMGNPLHVFAHLDINDGNAIRSLLQVHRPRAIVHFAAESHVDRSILGPRAFIETNASGTFHLLEETKAYWSELEDADKQAFRFLHVSTDEVYGSLGPSDPAFSETTPYAPNSPYSASKAASDHLIRAYFHTYGLPTLTTNCSNNYGPYQFPEKLIPLVILNAIEGKPLPIYGDGQNIRDWLYVGDHCAAIRAVLKDGRTGETYNIGGKNEMTNLDVIKTVCTILDELHPASRPIKGHASLVQFVKDRPGHDRRYAINPAKIEREIGWQPHETFTSGIRKTVEWYLANPEWVQSVRSGNYRQWIKTQYGEGASA